MRVKIQLPTSGIRAVVSCSLNISCSLPSTASQQPQLEAAAPAAPTHPSPSIQTSSSSSHGGTSSRSCSSPPAASHVRRALSALGRLERAAPAGGRARCSGGARASSGKDCRSSGKGVKGWQRRSWQQPGRRWRQRRQ
jgi:hypothetical protein